MVFLSIETLIKSRVPYKDSQIANLFCIVNVNQAQSKSLLPRLDV